MISSPIGSVVSTPPRSVGGSLLYASPGSRSPVKAVSFASPSKAGLDALGTYFSSNGFGRVEGKTIYLDMDQINNPDNKEYKGAIIGLLKPLINHADVQVCGDIVGSSFLALTPDNMGNLFPEYASERAAQFAVARVDLPIDCSSVDKKSREQILPYRAISNRPQTPRVRSKPYDKEITPGADFDAVMTVLKDIKSQLWECISPLKSDEVSTSVVFKSVPKISKLTREQRKALREVLDSPFGIVGLFDDLKTVKIQRAGSLDVVEVGLPGFVKALRDQYNIPANCFEDAVDRALVQLKKDLKSALDTNLLYSLGYCERGDITLKALRPVFDRWTDNDSVTLRFTCSSKATMVYDALATALEPFVHSLDTPNSFREDGKSNSVISLKIVVDGELYHLLEKSL